MIIGGGPLSYQYTLADLVLHFGRQNDRGSEHTIDAVPFPAELQLYAYNSQLFSNLTEAKHESNGVLAIAILIQVTLTNSNANAQLKVMTDSLRELSFKGEILIQISGIQK